MALALPQTEPPPAAVDAAEAVDPVESARAAGLRYVSDLTPGIRRERAGNEFRYTGSDGHPIRDPGSRRITVHKAPARARPRDSRLHISHVPEPRCLGGIFRRREGVNRLRAGPTSWHRSLERVRGLA